MSIKTWLRFPLDLQTARRLLAERPSAELDLPQRPLMLDLSSTDLVFDGGRHLAAIGMHAIALGSPVQLCCEDSVLAAMARKRYGRQLLAMPGVTHFTPEFKASAHDAWILSDHAADQSHPHRDIWMRVGRDVETHLPVMPYPMHPATLADGSFEDINSIRTNRDRALVFFAGNQKRTYGEGKIRRDFGICDRIEMLQTVNSHFADRVMGMFAGTDSKSIVLIDSRYSPIEATHWLPTLSRASFFLCCPGSSQPTCHHLVEAMSVGTIPILEYADRVTPPLVDGQTAITFRGVSGLREAINRVSSMSLQEISEMRARVIDHFDQHLCQRRFLRGIRDGSIDTSLGQISMPFHNTNFYSASAVQAA